jgi:CheY-like chemotaxis protein
MAKTTAPRTIVVLDDEPFSVSWLAEYLEDQGYHVRSFTNANEAAEQVETEIYRCLILDLNVPLFGPLDTLASSRGEVYRKYPGLYVALVARNKGYRDRQVIIYSVHRDVEVAEEARKLGCTYILKGRPRELKAEIDQVLAFDPTVTTDPATR